MYNNILVTSTNSAYYESLLTLISGVHQYSVDIVDRIFIYNLGLDVNEIKTLNAHERNVICLCLLPNNKLASGSDDKTIKICFTHISVTDN